MKKNNFIEGTIISYIVILLTKIAGAFYVIPFYKIIGSSGGVLYSYAYNVYNVFLDISTSGIPTAISILIAEYNTLKMFKEREFVYNTANKVITIISFFSFIIMFVFAGSFANFFIGDIQGANSIQSVKLVIRVISFCLLIIPFLSITRGYLQGNKYISVSSFSQLIEQLTRIFILLLGSYVAINVLHYDVTIGVAVALTGTIIGGLVALLFLKFRIKKNKDLFNVNVKNDKEISISRNEVIKKILLTSLPIVVISITQNIYSAVDLKLIIKGLYMIGYDGAKCELLASIIITWAPKICMIINALATGLCVSIVPFIVSNFVEKNFKELNIKFNQAINTIIYIALPLSLIIIVLSKYIYYIFYEYSNYGTIALKVLPIVSIFFTIQLVINMILQGMKKYKIVYLNTFIGLIVNILLDIPIILFFDKIGFYPYLGSLFATIIGQTVSIIIVFVAMKKEFNFNYSSIFKTTIMTFIYLVVMFLELMLFKNIFFNSDKYIIIFIELLITGIICIITYICISYMFGTIDDVFGKNFINKLKNKIKH